MNLNTIHSAIQRTIEQQRGQLVSATPAAIAVTLVSATVLSLLPEGSLPTDPILVGSLVRLGELGLGSLHEFAKAFFETLQTEEGQQYSAEEIRQRFEQALLDRWHASRNSLDARALRQDASRLLQSVQGVNAALSGVPAELRQPLVDGLIELGSSLEEFRWILIEERELLVEIRQRSQDIMSDVQRLVRRVARLEQHQEALPAKLKLLLLIQSEQSASPSVVPPAAGSSPYKGLPAFEKQDAGYFFGREELEADLVHQLVQGKRFLAVIGASGSGKSSLVQAGLLPHLETNTAHQLLGSRDWRLVLLKPGAEPLVQLADQMSVVGLRGNLSTRYLNSMRRDLLSGFRANPSELAQVIEQLLSTEPAHVRLLLIVDQFEEIFTRCRSESERRHFIDALLYATESRASRAIVLITMRADFYGHCAEHARLRDHIQDHHLLVGPLHENELRRVIEQPARKAGLQIEPGLTELIIKDVADAPGALPLLSQALLETWKRRQGDTLTRAGYEASGGVREAIARTAETVYSQQLSAQQQQEARHLFLRLVEVGESEQYDTRRRTPRREIEDVASQVLVTLADARLIITDRETVEVAHEALIREWPRLRNWLDDNREGLRLHRYLTEAAQEWERLGRDAGALYRGLQLAKASEWAAKPESHLNTLEEEFLRESQRAEEEARQRELQQARALEQAQRERAKEAEKRARDQSKANTRLRRLAAVLAVVFLVAVGIAFYANTKAEEALEAEATADVARDDADQKAEEALEAQAAAEVARNDAEEAALLEIEAREATEQQVRIAMAGQLAAQSQTALEDYPQRSLLLAVEALQSTMRENEPRVLDAEQALRDALANAGGIGLSGHESSINAVAISPDNRFLVTASGNVIGSSDNTARLWDLTANDPAASPMVLTGHEDWIRAVVISPNNHWLVTASSDHTARLWDLTANDPAATPILLTGHEESINAVAISPNNHWLVTASGHVVVNNDNTARLWDLTANDPAASSIVLTGHESSVNAVAISPDNHWLVTASSDHTARLWDLTVLDPAATSIVLTGHEDDIETVTISPNNHWLVTGSSDRTARLWDLRANDTAANSIVLTGHEGVIVALTISPDNHWLVTGSADRTARLWDLTANDPAASPIVLAGHESSINAVAISPDNHWLVTGSHDGTARLWDLTANDPAATFTVLTGHEDPINVVAISPNNHWLVTGSGHVAGSYDNTARLWDLTANDPAASPIVLTGHNDSINTVAISPDNHWLVTANGYINSSDNTVRLWDLTANDPAATPILLTSHDSSIGAVAISPDNHWLVTGSVDRTARLWDLTANDPAASPIVLAGHEDLISEVAISPDNHWLVTGSSDNTARLWDLTANDPAASFIVLTGHEYGIRAIAISPNNHWLVTGSGDSTARLWDLTANDPAASPIVLTGHEKSIGAVAISQNNHWLVTGSDDNTARLWDLTANDPAASPIVLAGHEGSITEVAISPDNHWLVTASNDKTARLWDLTANDPAASPIVLTGHEGSITEVAISPDNHWLVTASDDNTARLWNLRIDELIELACRTAGRNLTQTEWTQYFGAQEYRKTCPNLPVHHTVINALKREGQNLAKEGDIDGAMAKFRQALALEPTSEVDPEVEARRLVAEVLVERGKELAKEGDVEGAIAQYQKALELDPSLQIDPEREAGQLAAEVIVERGEELAREGDVEGAIAKFQEALELDPSLEIEPETEARKLAGWKLYIKGRDLAEQGEIEEAIAAYSEAEAIFEPVSLRLSIPAESWDRLCWFGSLWGYASDVMYACEQAIESADEERIDYHRDSRGLARALTGDYAGAIEDFRLFVEWSRQNGEYERFGPSREAWIAELEAGRNPFDAETLERLRN